MSQFDESLIRQPQLLLPRSYRPQNLMSSCGGKLTHGQELQERPSRTVPGNADCGYLSPDSHTGSVLIHSALCASGLAEAGRKQTH